MAFDPAQIDPDMPSSRSADPMELGAFARKQIARRRRRDQILGAELFGEPIWDMLLDLFANAQEGREVSISSLCIAAGVPTTSALRYIAMLVDRGLLIRRQDSRDGRRILMELSPALHARLGELLLSWIKNEGD